MDTAQMKLKKELKCECIWILFCFLVFVWTMIWLYVTQIVNNDMHNFNEFMFRSQGWWLDWSLVVVTVTAVLLTYCSLLLILLLCLVLCSQPLRLHWIHKVLLCLCAAAVSLGVVFLDVKWKEEWEAVAISLQVTAPFLHIGAVIGVSILAWVLAAYYWGANSRVFRNVLLAVYILVLCALYVSPLFISSPCIMKAEQLPPKPRLFGHRGAPMLAPENTMLSFYKMVESNVDVFESDVMVSHDGIPFLMHDNFLLRTTNIGQVFPGREREDSGNFTWSELRELDAGEWFLQRNPFRTGGSQALLSQQGRKIPSLSELLAAAETLNISIIFDLRPPPPGHPYNETYLNVTLETILKSPIRQELVLWLPDEERDEVIALAPGFRQIYGRRRQENDTFDAVNLSYKNISVSEIRSYIQNNITVNLYVVNYPWLYSHFWCAGVTSVTTNACHILQDLARPLWVLDPKHYLLIWIVADCISFLHVIWAFVIQRKCSRVKEEKDAEGVLLMKIQNLT
ncbi:glycerophosphoinositol inositolphosphodiesterase GDPD2 isoform X2 [Bombina bombina]|uniref:glycerophosphoinositol inositolphosphodiesterase GDPD2 isoform X2 n=1 Tax=Bombina bombina TaxID=8345 RepID=UPI00235AC464|nr:glycerophosphoinositol inositolphosphodiesterase GDPD2 isoform X2 [Bombina bombina]